MWIALAMSVLSLVMGWFLGPWGFAATVVGVLAAWAYSAEPVRLKRSGWWGPGLVGLSYESLPWFTGAAVLSAAPGDAQHHIYEEIEDAVTDAVEAGESAAEIVVNGYTYTMSIESEERC